MKKKNGSVWLLVVIAALGVFGMYAYSNFAIAQTSGSVSTLQKWTYKTDGEKQSIGTVNLLETINTKINSSVGTIAPGTEGAFDVVLDGSRSSKELEYKIDFEIVEKPTNLHFYTDSECKNQVPEKDGVAQISGTIDLENIKKPVNKTIYWKWAFETGNSEEEIMKNDEIDTIEQGKDALFNVFVTGTKKE